MTSNHWVFTCPQIRYKGWIRLDLERNGLRQILHASDASLQTPTSQIKDPVLQSWLKVKLAAIIWFKNMQVKREQNKIHVMLGDLWSDSTLYDVIRGMFKLKFLMGEGAFTLIK